MGAEGRATCKPNVVKAKMDFNGNGLMYHSSCKNPRKDPEPDKTDAQPPPPPASFLRRSSHPVTMSFGSKLSSTRNSTGSTSVPSTSVPRRRRLSQVSEVLSRRVSTTLVGWRSTVTVVNAAQIANEAKSLCSQYIRARLRRSGLLERKLGLMRLRSVLSMTLNYGCCEVNAELNLLGKELEAMYPKLYRSVCRQVCVTLTSQDVVGKVFNRIAQGIFKDGTVTWGRIVALFAVAGGLAVDSVNQGHADYITCLIESLGGFVEEELAAWISQQGGWVSLLRRFKPRPYPALLPRLTVLALVVLIAISFISAYMYIYS